MAAKNVSTQIRTFYSEGHSYLTLKFFNTGLSLALTKFEGMDNNGKRIYAKEALYTTVNYESAYALYKSCMDIVNGTITGELDISVPGSLGAIVTLRRSKNNNGFDTVLAIVKDNNTTVFYFSKFEQKIDNSVKIVEAGLGAFAKTIEGYLTGINADRHLNKLTDEFVKTKETQPSQNNSGYYQKKNYNRPYNNYRGNNKGNYNRNYNNRGYYNQNNPPFDMPRQNQQNFSEYQLPR